MDTLTKISKLEQPLLLGLTLLLAGCLARSSAWQEPAPAFEGAQHAPMTGLAKDGHWVLLPEQTTADYFAKDPDGTQRLLAFGLRLIQAPNGALEHSQDFIPASSIQVTELPARLGGGYLFAGEQAGETLLWRARTWTGLLQPLSRVSERVESIVVGFDRLYLDLSLEFRWGAIDLETGAAVDLAPLPEAPSFTSMAFADAWFAAVSTDVQGVLVTFDAGSSWHPLEGMGAEPRVRTSGLDIVIENGEERLRLTSQGQLQRYATKHGQELFSAQDPEARALLEPGERRAPPPGPEFPDALRAAVLHGWPMASGEAVVATHGALLRVRLRDGALLQTARSAYPGDKPCQAVSLGQGVGFVCQEEPHGTSLYRLKQGFELALERRFATTRVIRASGNGALVITGPCEDSRVLDGARYCVRHRDGKSSEVRVRGDAGVERVVALSSGDVALLVPPRLGASGRLTLIHGSNQSSVELTLPDDEHEAAVLETGLWLDQLGQIAKDRIGTWVAGSRAYRGVEISLDGKVIAHQPPDGGSISRAVFSGALAFEATPSGVAWLSQNFGKDWTQRTAPPGFYPLEERTALLALGRAPSVGCSRVGCVYGAWLHIGHPDSDEAKSEEETDAGATVNPSSAEADLSEKDPSSISDEVRQADIPQRVQFNPSSYFSWRPQCFPLGKTGPALSVTEKRFDAQVEEGPHRGLRTGFSPLLLSGGGIAAPTNTVFRPFLGIPGPETAKSDVRLDRGSDALPRFRAYAFGSPAAQWANSAVWQVRVAPLFGEQNAWATALTYAPWADADGTAELFGGSDRPDSGSDWSLDLDPDEAGGILRIATSLSPQLHVVAEGRAVQSYGTSFGGRLAGAVKVRGGWYYGQHEGDDFRLFQLGATGPTRLGNYAVRTAHRATLVRSRDAERLGILVRTRIGAWYVYPLSDDYQAEVPLVVSREQLNRRPSPCGAESSGWLVVAPTPLTRFDGQLESSLVAFDGDLADWRAKALHAKVVVSDGAVCVEELSAEASRKSNEQAIPAASIDAVADTVPLTLLDAFVGRKLLFRCAL